MKHKATVVLVLCLAAVAMLGIGAAPAGAATGGLPQVGNPDVAHVWPDGGWWSGGNGWGGAIEYVPGVPIPAQDTVTMYNSVDLPDKAVMEQLSQIFLLSVTVRAADGDIIVMTTEGQSAQFWGKVEWYPAAADWWRPWEVPVGQLPAGTYRITFVAHLTTALEITVPDGDPVVIKPFKDISRSMFTVQ